MDIKRISVYVFIAMYWSPFDPCTSLKRHTECNWFGNNIAGSLFPFSNYSSQVCVILSAFCYLGFCNCNCSMKQWLEGPWWMCLRRSSLGIQMYMSTQLLHTKTSKRWHQSVQDAVFRLLRNRWICLNLDAFVEGSYCCSLGKWDGFRCIHSE